MADEKTTRPIFSVAEVPTAERQGILLPVGTWSFDHFFYVFCVLKLSI